MRQGNEALNSFAALSLDAELTAGEAGRSLGDTLGSPDPGMDRVVDRETVRPRLRRLPEREKRILYLRFFRGMSQSDIAGEFGISQMHVSRLISRSCERIRREVSRERVPRPVG